MYPNGFTPRAQKSLKPEKEPSREIVVFFFFLLLLLLMAWALHLNIWHGKEMHFQTPLIINCHNLNPKESKSVKKNHHEKQ